jgi:hypothetical protein
MTRRPAPRSFLAAEQTAIQLHGTPLRGGCRVALADSFPRVADPGTVLPLGHSTFPQFLNTEETAAVLGISPSTLNRWAARREAGEDVGPPFRAVSGKVRRWLVDELLDWLDDQKR